MMRRYSSGRSVENDDVEGRTRHKYENGERDGCEPLRGACFEMPKVSQTTR